ncbi:MAG: DegT/DnrJ/EryC1/StrS family aminotransferase [Chroococcus sp. CMT-3BRIN-NPC107]|nr:DegT/DnrJ/EryC1/StrS family aminotransferase [Chroococcus sp. CMT-3BRIN-NPC107]
MNFIPPLDLTQQYKSIEVEVNEAVSKVLASGRYIGGSLVEGFEQQFADYIGVSHCIACNSGTDALYLALRALNIGAGDEVITTPFTFIATSEAIASVGATPVFVDIDAATFNLNLDFVEAAITAKTKAIIPVHLFGQPVDMTGLLEVVSRHQIALIEDCAQSTGAAWGQFKVGSIGIGCFSFFPTKNLGACGDGGAVTTNDPAIASTIKSLREHGQKERYIHDENGINSRLDSLQAAILMVKLRYLDSWNSQRSAIASNYQQLLSPIPGIVAPQELVGSNAVWNQYTIRVLKGRNEVRDLLQERGISSMVYYPRPLHLQPVYEHLGYKQGQFPVAEEASHQVLSLPMFPELSHLQQQQVVYSLKDCLM